MHPSDRLAELCANYATADELAAEYERIVAMDDIYERYGALTVNTSLAIAYARRLEREVEEREAPTPLERLGA